MDLYQIARTIQDENINLAWRRLSRLMREVEDAERRIQQKSGPFARLINRATAKVTRWNARMAAKMLNEQLEKAGRPECFDVGVI